MADQRSLAAPAPIVALAAWLLPGSGYWLIGQRVRGLTIGITVTFLFVLGVFIAGVRVVEAPNLGGPGGPVAQIAQRPWFVGQVLTGPMSLVAAWCSSSAAGDVRYRLIVTHARLAEIGTLYTAVAGMLNLLAIIDCSYRAAQGDAK